MALKKGLGKGLGALIADEPDQYPLEDKSKIKILEVDINKIEPNKDQPRKYFEESALQELAESVKQYGVLQPLIVKDEGDYYSIIAGERRWRAARLAHTEKVPVIVKEYTPAEILQIALIENIQRKDLNPIEEALCYRRLMDEFFFTQENIAEKVGRSRSSIANALRLLTLDSRVQQLVIENKLSEGQARALLSIDDGTLQFDTAEKVIDDQLSVRETTAYIKLLLEEKEQEEAVEEPKKEAPKQDHLVTYRSIETDLKAILGTRVNIKEKDEKGKIEIEYDSHDDLDRLLLMFRKL